MDLLRQTFRPHQYGINEQHLDLYHVDDNLSRTPFQHGVGIQCEDPDTYIMNAWHVITPIAMKAQLTWSNRRATQFVSFYQDLTDARREAQRRIQTTYVPGVGRRDPGSVRIAHVRLHRESGVWAFSRDEMLDMIGVFYPQHRQELLAMSARSEWFVWGVVPEEFVQNREQL